MNPQICRVNMINMKIKISSSKESQFFFYAYHMSKWHFSALKEVADVWIKETGELTKDEKVALRDIRSVLKKYNFGDRYLGNVYIKFSKSNIDLTLLSVRLYKLDMVVFSPIPIAGAHSTIFSISGLFLANNIPPPRLLPTA